MIGAGSIGTRHARLVGELGAAVRIVSRRPGHGDFEEIQHALLAWDPDYVIVSNETAARADSVSSLISLGYSGRLLIEKPLGSVPPELFDAPCQTWVGYNLRFHPVIDALRAEIDTAKVLTVQARAGQYLPDWRPGRDYRDTASNLPGGGVLRDLSHEVDLLEWLVGPCRSVSALIGTLSNLELDVEDVSAALMQYERAPIVTLELNYLDRRAQRTMHVTTDDHIITGDLLDGTLTVDGTVVSSARPGRDDTYLAMHRAILTGETERMCTLTQGQRVMDVIEGIERSAASKSWVEL